MSDPKFAERWLALFIAPERAANIVGDLLEESTPHSRVWFWAQLARTTAGLFARQVTDAPVRLLLIWLMAQMIVILGPALIWSLAVPGWYPIVAYLCAKLIPFLVGLGAATMSRGRELSFALVLGIFDGNQIAVLVYLNTHEHDYPWTKAFSFFTLLCYLSAAFLVRRRRHRSFAS